MTNLEENKAVARHYFDLLTRNDIPGLMAIYDPEMKLIVPGTTLISGTFTRDQLEKFAASVLDMFPEGLKFTVKSMTAEDDRVAVEAESIGRHASGAMYNNHYHFVIRIRNGKVFESREYMDTQLVTDVICGGKRPPPATTSAK